MRYIYLFAVWLVMDFAVYGQVAVSLPIDFESGIVTTGNFGNFNGGTATVVSNPFPSGTNTSATVGRLVRNGGAVFAGSYLNMTTALDFSTNTSICMKVYTTANVGTPVVLKIEVGGAPLEITQNTTVSGAWETLCFDFSGAPANNTRLTFLFNLGQVGNGTTNSTFYFDDIEQPAALSGNEIPLPIDFEGGTVIDDNFGDIGGGFMGGNGFEGGVATVIPNPQQNGINTSATVGRIVRHQTAFAGTFVDLPTNLNFDLNTIICLKVYTTAPVGTKVTMKLEDPDTGQPDLFRDAFTVGTAEWESLCFVFAGVTDAYNRMTFLFDFESMGNGGIDDTFFFDDVEQILTPLFFGPGSQFFCPDLSLTLTYPDGSGNYQWFSDPGATNLVGTGPTYTTPVLTSSTSFYVRDMASVNVSTPFDVGPSLLGPAADLAGPLTATVDFTSNIDNGDWHGVDIVSKFLTTAGPCTYTVTGHNLTLASSTTTARTIDMTIPANDNAKQEYLFSPPVPMDIGNSMQLEVTLTGGSGCRLRSFFLGGPTIPGYPSTTSGGELTYTGYNIVPNNPSLEDQRWMGFDYQVSGDILADPTLFQVNAIADCANPLPIELLDFSVREDNGDALLSWSTASELNNDRFLLQRTKDGVEFKTVGIVNGAGNSSTVLHYSFTDRNPEKGLSYYKLVQVDFDGTETSSELKPFTNESSGVFHLFPNPTSEELTLTLNEGYERIEVRVYDLSGRMINQYFFSSTENVTFRLEGHSGTYFIEVLADEERKAMFNVLKL